MNILDGYWVAGTNPTTQVFSTAAGVEDFVSNTASAYLSWLTAGNFGFITSILGSADNGSGKVRLQVFDASSLQTGQQMRIQGSASYDANYSITKIDSTHVDITSLTYTGASVSGANLQGAAILATDAALWATFDTYAQTAWLSGAQTLSGVGPFTLTNSLPSYNSIVLTGSTHTVTLPKMRTPRAIPIGRQFVVRNASTAGYVVGNTQYFGVYASDGTTLIAFVNPGETFGFTLLDNSTANGSFLNNNIGRGSSTYGVRRLQAFNDASGPTHIMSISFSEVVLRDGVGNAMMYAGNTQPCDISFGPGVQMRDQAGAFAVSSFCHWYAIGGVGLSWRPIVSAAADPATTTNGPTLPAGYTHWAYLFSSRIDGAGNLVRVHANGNLVSLDDANTSGLALSAGAATGATPTNAVSLSAIIPAAADTIELQMRGTNGAVVGTVSGSTIARTVGAAGTGVRVPNVSQQVFYNNLAAGTLDIVAASYTVPNGG